MSARVTNEYSFQGMHADDMKKAYKRLALSLHPDVNKAPDATERMKVLNGEFAYWYARAARDYVYERKVADKPESKDYYYRTYHASNFVSSLSEAIEKLLASGIYTSDVYDVELIGTFIWIFGVGKEDRMEHETLRNLGFRFKIKMDEERGSVPAWFYTPNYRAVRSNTSRQNNERTYGSQKIYGSNGLPSSTD